MQLDIRTMILVLALGNVLMATGLFAVRREHEHTPGLKRWTWSVALQALAWLLLGLPEQVWDFAAIVVANTLLAASYALQYVAIREYKEGEGRWPLALGIVGAVLLGFVFLHAAGADPRTRLIATSAATALLMALSAVELFRDTPEGERTLRRLTGAGFAACSVVVALRAVHAAWADQPTLSLLDPTAVQSLTFVSLYVAVVGLTFGFILMAKARAEGQIRHLATRDALTGTLNRRCFLDLAERELARAARSASPVAVVLFDLDHFKRINDTYGHAVGDEVLREFVRTIEGALRASDLFGRYGGEEFCAVLPDTDAEGALAAAQRLLGYLSERAVSGDGACVRFTASAGVAVRIPEQSGRMEELLARADAALYEAKTAGRNRAVLDPYRSEFDVPKRMRAAADAEEARAPAQPVLPPEVQSGALAGSRSSSQPGAGPGVLASASST